MVRALEVLAGSSPHKWGILAPANLPKELPRFIPTQVGNTILAITIPFSAGFIPTQVGNTGVVRVLLTLSSVHPHTSGEYFSRYLLTLSAPGSSPHKWGIQHLSLVTLYVTRFIPTQVGNTYSCIVHVSPLPVHPHTSGEYVSNSSPGRRHCGSSPHKWGIRNSSLVLLKPLRFIPTQVGNTRSSRLMEDGSLGSSPHKWGILLRHITHPDILRFIPTQVGNTCSSCLKRLPFAVHPHTSGEYTCQ